MQNRLPGLALNIAFQTTRRFLEMQTQPVPDPCSPTARAHPSLPHIPSFTLTRTHTRVQTHTHRAARPRTPRHPWLSQVSPPRAPAGPPASGAPLAPPPPTHAHACTPRAPAPGGGTRWVGGGAEGTGQGPGSGVPQSIPRSPSANCVPARRLRAPLWLPNPRSWR